MAKPLSFDEFVKLKQAQNSKADKLDQLIQDESLKMQSLPEQEAIEKADYINKEIIPLRHKIKEQEKEELLNAALQTPGSDESSLPIATPNRQLNEIAPEQAQAPIQEQPLPVQPEPENRVFPNAQPARREQMEAQPSSTTPEIPQEIEQPRVAPTEQQPEPPSAPQSNFPPEEQLINNGYNNASLDNLKDVQSQQNTSNLLANLSKVGETLGSRFTGTPESNVSSNIFKQNANDIGEQYTQQIQIQKQDPESAISKTYKDYFKSLTGRDVNPNVSAFDIEKILPYGVREQLQKQEIQKALDVANLKTKSQQELNISKEKQKEEDRNLQKMKEDRRDERLDKSLTQSMKKTEQAQNIRNLQQEKQLETPYGLAKTKEDAKKIKDSSELKDNFDRKLQELIDLRKTYGAEVFNRDAVARGKQLSKDLLLAYKDMSKLGVLSKADEAILNAIIPSDPLGFSGASLLGQDPIMTKLTSFQGDVNKDFENKLNTRLQSRSEVGQAQPNSGKVDDEEAKSRARQARIAELKAKQGK